MMTHYEDAEGTYHHAEKEVTIQLRDGSLRDMKTVLRAVLTMWITEFKVRGLLQRVESPKLEAHVIHPRSTTSGAAPMTLTIQQGLRFKRSFRRQKFNYETEEIEPIDITGHTYKFAIYKPVDADIVMTNNRTGQKIEGTVQLSAEETIHWRALKTEDDRKAFEATLAAKYARHLLARATR